jgi:hypothetical protein
LEWVISFKPRLLYPRYPFIGGWFDLRAGFDALEKGNVSRSCREQELDFSKDQPIT